ncbi:MAG: Maf family protein [Bacteroidota bacterium]
MIITTEPIILASQSPRRAHLLTQIGLNFTVQPSGIIEEINPSHSSEENVQRLSLHKAEDVAKKNKRGIVIGSDTIVVIDSIVLGKPVSEEDAKLMLRTLSGRTHTVFTGFALVDVKTKKSYIDYGKTEVTFRRLSDQEIANYVASGSPMDKAGAYGIQDDFGAVFVEKIVGDYYTVVGFPLSKFYLAVTKFAHDLGYLKGTV